MSHYHFGVATFLTCACLCNSAFGQTTTAPAEEAATSAASAQSTEQTESTATAQTQQPAASKGLLAIPNYTGDLITRQYLLGDFGGSRTDWANKGIQFQVDWSQYLQSVVDGGRDETTQYGGHLNYLLYMDFMRMGVMDGAMLKVRAESRYGNSVNTQAGPILPVNTDAFVPITSPADEDVAITVTDLLYTQFLSEEFAVFLGKMDTYDGDPNEFASGRGTSQFMNFNFVFNPVLALRLPYSTLGAGVVWLPTKNITVTSSVFNTVDASTTTGFSDFGEGGSSSTEANFQYRLGRLPGGQNVGFLYSFDQDFLAIRGQFVFVPGEGLVAPTRNNTWAAYWSGWQYLCTNQHVDKPLNITNGEQDLQGMGVFARFGFADKNTNPVEWSGSIGLGARGLIPSRLNDTCGIGFFYSDIQTNQLTGFLGVKDNAQGLEAFYNVALTRATALTFDVQVVEAPSSNLDTAVILGARLGLTF